MPSAAGPALRPPSVVAVSAVRYRKAAFTAGAGAGAFIKPVRIFRGAVKRIPTANKKMKYRCKFQSGPPLNLKNENGHFHVPCQSIYFIFSSNGDRWLFECNLAFILLFLFSTSDRSGRWFRSNESWMFTEMRCRYNDFVVARVIFDD